MPRRKYLFILSLLLFAAPHAKAEYLNGTELLNHCTAYIDNESPQDNLCPAFITGIASIHETFVNWGGHRREWCMPEQLQTRQLVKLVTGDMMKQAPETLIYSAENVVAFSLVKLFPCRSQ